MSEGSPFRVASPEFLNWPELRQVLGVIGDARVVGGAVRDSLLGQPVADVDLATPRTPERVVDSLRAAGIRAIPTGIAHGTVTALVGERSFEITTLRRDVTTDGRHAEVAFTTVWRDDAARRDFTINALSMTASAEMFDYFGGLADLRAGRVRFVGDPVRRIAEDYLRILRFFRFHARFGRVPPDQETAAAISAAASGLARLSAERIWNELRRILVGPNPGAAVGLMAELGVLRVLLPKGADPARLQSVVDAGAPPDPLIRLAALLCRNADADAVAERLKLSTTERDRVLAIRGGPVPQPVLDDGGLRRLLADEASDILIARTWLSGAGSSDWAVLRDRLRSLEQPRFPLSGRDVVSAGIPPGPEVGKLLAKVRRWWIEHDCVPDATACRERLLGLL